MDQSEPMKELSDMKLPSHQEKGEADVWLGGRGPRLTPSQRRRIREFCIKRDGTRCMICGRDADLASLEIDHKDGNAGNNLASNLQLVHHSCNSKQWNRMFSMGKLPSVQGKREKGLQAAYIDSTSPEVILNREYEPTFRRYCFEQVRKVKVENGSLSKQQLRILAREFVGCSQQTSYSYMERLFAPNGPFIEKQDIYAGTFYVDFRDPRDINLSLEELTAKYPKEGRRRAEPVD